MRKLVLLVLFMAACAGAVSNQDAAQTDSSPDACSVPPSWVSSSGTCKGLYRDDYQCVTECGELPPDGGLGVLLPVGCLLQIGTSTYETALCVSSCSECSP